MFRTRLLQRLPIASLLVLHPLIGHSTLIDFGAGSAPVTGASGTSMGTVSVGGLTTGWTLDWSGGGNAVTGADTATNGNQNGASVTYLGGGGINPGPMVFSLQFDDPVDLTIGSLSATGTGITGIQDSFGEFSNVPSAIDPQPVSGAGEFVESGAPDFETRITNENGGTSLYWVGSGTSLSTLTWEHGSDGSGGRGEIWTVDVTAIVPEPGTAGLLFGSLLVGLFHRGRRL